MESQLYFVFLASFCALYVLWHMAKKIQLVDTPNERKHHQGVIPLIGGLSIFASVATCALIFPLSTTESNTYLLLSSILVFVGAVDDKLDISVKFRIAVQVAVSLSLIIVSDLKLAQLGNIFGFGDITLSNALSYAITVLAVAGAINAFNMVDGIDGLLGGLSVISFAALGFLFMLAGNTDLYSFCQIIVIATIPYLMLNLGFPFGKQWKIFMGDAGSVFIGFTVVWLLLHGTQSEQASFKPVTALWVIALPLMDMATIMIRRLRKKQSPFKPDREHLHHICQRLGMSPIMTLCMICLFAASLALIGIIGEINGVADYVMFAGFMATFTLYYTTICYIWRITALIRRLQASIMPRFYSKMDNIKK